MPEPVLDTVALRVMTFAHPDGLDILLTTLAAPRARFPAEVYNRDEDALAPDARDDVLSELARGLRYARHQAGSLPAPAAERYRTRLRHAEQLSRHLAGGTLVVDPLTLEELPRREELREVYGIGRGEAACLVLAERHGTQVVFLSSDAEACRVAGVLGLPYLTLQDVLERWVASMSPPLAALDAVLDGMREARFRLREEIVRTLRQQLGGG